MLEGSIHFSTCIYTTQMLSLLNSLKLIFLDGARTGFWSGLFLLINLNELVRFKKSFFLTFSWQNEKSFALLDSIHPLAFIACSIKPIHFSKPSSNILFIVTLIDVPSCPAKDSIAMLLILQILSLIFIAVSYSFFPHSMPFSQTFFEPSFIIASICPIIFAVSVWLSSRILAFVQITICKFLSSLTVLQAIFETSFIPIPIDPYMYSIALCFAKPPLSNITISFDTFPHPRTMFQTVNPFTFVKFTVRPSVLSNSLRLTIHVFAQIATTIGKLLISHSLLVVSLPISFIDPIVVIDHDSLTMTLPIDNLSIISSFTIFFQLQIGRGPHLHEIKKFGTGYILLKLLHQVIIWRLTEHRAHV